MFKRRKQMLLSFVSCGLLLIVADTQADQNTASEQPNQESVTTAQPRAQGGFMAFIDPETGQLTSPTEGQARELMPLSYDEQNAMSTSHSGLYMEEIPGEGMKVDLQGRFQSSVFATVDDSGEVSISHGIDTAGENQLMSGEQSNQQKQGE